MAGLYVILGQSEPARIEAAARRLTYFEGESVSLRNEDRCAFAWVGVNDPRLWGPAFDPQTGLYVLLSGRVAFEEPQWQAAERLTHLTGGLACKLLLDLYLTGGAEALERHNGPAALVIWDPRSDELHLYSDHFGYHPVFLYRAEAVDGAVIATAPDAIAGDDQVTVSDDDVSMVEFLSAWRTTPPHTYYQGIRYAGAATHVTWRLRDKKFHERIYWTPFQDGFYGTFGEASRALESALQPAIRNRTLPRLGPVLSFTSGGMDSRAVLFAAHPDSEIIALNLYDEPNRESLVAQQLCKVCGARYLGFARDKDYYPRLMRETTRLSNGMWSIEDQHYLGVRGVVGAVGANTVLTACTTDWLFKGYGLEKRHRTLFGKNLPLHALVPRRADAFLPNWPRPVPAEYERQVRDRFDAWFAGVPRELTEDRHWLLAEDKRIRPACYAVSVSGGSMYRMYPYDTFLGDRAIADCYSRMPAKWKLNARVWGDAVSHMAGAARDVVNANSGARLGASRGEILGSFAAGWLKRRLFPSKGTAGEGLATEGSWPNYGWYVEHSTTLRDFWAAVPGEDRQRVARYWGSDAWAVPSEQWRQVPLDYFRLLTLLNWLDLRREARRDSP